jgi:copper chaperone CopZ
MAEVYRTVGSLRYCFFMTQATRIDIEGMHCDACSRRVRAALDNLPGVSVSDVKVGQAHVERDPAVASDESIRTAVEAQDFRVTSVAPSA